MRTRLFVAIFGIAVLVGFLSTSLSVRAGGDLYNKPQSAVVQQSMGQPTTVFTAEDNYLTDSLVSDLNEDGTDEVILVDEINPHDPSYLDHEVYSRISIYQRVSASIGLNLVYRMDLDQGWVVEDINTMSNIDGFRDVLVTASEWDVGHAGPDSPHVVGGRFFKISNEGTWRFTVKESDGSSSYPTSMVPFSLTTGENMIAVVSYDGDFYAGLGQCCLRIFNSNLEETANYNLPVEVDFSPYPLYSADVNGDGNDDLVIEWNQADWPDHIDRPFSVWLNDGTGHFPERQDYVEDPLNLMWRSHRVRAILVADVDGDCSAEIIVDYQGDFGSGTGDDTRIIIYRWDRFESRFTEAQRLEYRIGTNIEFVNTMHLIDIDDDGDLDLTDVRTRSLFTDYMWMTTCLQVSPGQFGACYSSLSPRTTSHTFGGTFRFSFLANQDVWVDWDKDGRLDLLNTFVDWDELALNSKVLVGLEVALQKPTSATPKSVQTCPQRPQPSPIWSTFFPIAWAENALPFQP